MTTLTAPNQFFSDYLCQAIAEEGTTASKSKKAFLAFVSEEDLDLDDMATPAVFSTKQKAAAHSKPIKRDLRGTDALTTIERTVDGKSFIVFVLDYTEEHITQEAVFLAIGSTKSEAKRESAQVDH